MEVLEIFRPHERGKKTYHTTGDDYTDCTV